MTSRDDNPRGGDVRRAQTGERMRSPAASSTWPGVAPRLQLPEYRANQPSANTWGWRRCPELVSPLGSEQKSWVKTTSPGAGSKRELAMSSLIRKVISTAKAPGAIGPYSQAVVVDRTVYVSGQLGINPSSGQLVPGGVAEEAKQALINMGEILKAASCDYSNVVKTTVLLADINDFGTVNEIYKQYFKSSFPARAAYQVAALPKGGRVEIEAVAVQGPLTTA